MTKQNWARIVFSFLVVLQTSASEAARLCAPGIATTSIYFTPHIKDYCAGKIPCADFKRVVRDAGSGTVYGNRLLTYRGKIISKGRCPTAYGKSGSCLTPFISVAADMRYHNFGDIIQMPGLKGKTFRLPSGKFFKHPGYLVVQDIGGGVKGHNRYDVYTGAHGLYDKSNPIGIYAPMKFRFGAKQVCSSEKKFTIVRVGTSRQKQLLASIRESLNNSPSSLPDSNQLAYVRPGPEGSER